MRSRSAKAVISFLYSIFRPAHVAFVLSDSLEASLAEFLRTAPDGGREIEDDDENPALQIAEYHEKARLLVSYWCSDERAYLRRFQKSDGEMVVELSPGVERLFNYLEDISRTDFVGTESRFKNILSELKDLEQHVKSDPEERIEALEAEKSRIEAEIAAIKKNGSAPSYSALQVSERLSDISRRARDLLSDFRQVELNFREIMKEIYRAQSEAKSSRGQILGYTLDTSRRLRESPQGQSFSSFWSFISEDSGDKIGSMVREICAADENQGDDFLLNLKKYLYQAGHKVVEQNRTLSERINKMLSSSSAGKERRIDRLTLEIKEKMLLYVKNLENGAKAAPDNFMEVDGKCDIYFPQARYPVYPEQKYSAPVFSTFSADVLSSKAFRGLFNQFYIDEKRLRQNLASFREKKGGASFSLAELASVYPIEQGLAEVIAWYDIAQKEDGAKICADEKEIIRFTKNDSTIAVTLPRMIFQ